MPTAIVDVGAATVHLHGEACFFHESFEGLVGGGGPVDYSATGAERGKSGVKPRENVEALIAIHGESGGAIIDIEHDGIEAARGLPNDEGDILFCESHAGIFERFRGERVSRVAIPCDDGGQNFSLDDLRVRAKRCERGLQRETEAQPADENPGSTLRAQTFAGEFSQAVLGIVPAGGHEFSAAHRDAVVAVMLGELELTTVGGLGGIEESVFFQRV